MSKDINNLGAEVCAAERVYEKHSLETNKYNALAERGGTALADEAGNKIGAAQNNNFIQPAEDNKELLRAIFDASRDGILVEDDGAIVYANNAYARLLGYDDSDELVGSHVSKILTPEHAIRMKEFAAAHLGGKPLPSISGIEAKHRDGSQIQLEAVVSTSVVAGKTYFITAVRELCCKHAQLVGESEQRYRLLGDSILHQIWSADPNGKLDYVNARMLEYSGLTIDEALKQVWQDAVHPDDLALCAERWENSLQTGEPYEAEIRLRGADGNYRWHLGRATAGRDRDGNIIKWFGTNTDINDQKLTEESLRKSEETLRQSQKMEAIGTLTGGVAHDFNNLLTAILGNTQLALRKVEADSQLQTRLTEIEKAGERAAALTRQLLAFSRRQHLDRRAVTLNDSVCEMTKMLERIIGEDIEVSVKCAPDLSTVFADTAQIEQVIMNLAVNARDAMPGGGNLIIETSNVELDDAYSRQYPYIQPGKFIQISVSDSGTGMCEDTKARIFEPFFTTKPVGKGTGLGLSMAYGIVKQHDGHINVYSEIGHGTTFKIFLPVDEKVAKTEKQINQLPLFGGSETILVAEDEEALRIIAKDILEDLGYTVLLAKNGEEAVETYHANRDRIDLLLFDVVMPRIGGSEAFEQIQSAGSDAPLILMTGYSSETVQSRYVKPKKSGKNIESTVLQKPYNVATLGHKVREALDGRLKRKH